MSKQRRLGGRGAHRATTRFSGRQATIIVVAVCAAVIGAPAVAWATVGYFTSTTNRAAAATGVNSSSGGGAKGVYGFATATSGSTYGVYGRTKSAAGFGVFSAGRLGTSGALVCPHCVTGGDINASTFPTVPSANDANSLGGVPAGSIYQPCAGNASDGQDGTIKGKAVIDGSTATSTLSTTGVTHGFVCTGQHVQVKRFSAGQYQVVFGDVENPVSHNIGIPQLATGDFVLITVQTSGLVAKATGPAQCAASPPPSTTCFPVTVTNLSGTLTDGVFGIALV